MQSQQTTESAKEARNAGAALLLAATCQGCGLSLLIASRRSLPQQEQAQATGFKEASSNTDETQARSSRDPL